MGGLCGVSSKQHDAEVQPRGRTRHVSGNSNVTESQGVNHVTPVKKSEEKKEDRFKDMEEFKGILYC